MGRHRAPDDDEPSDEYPESQPEDFGDDAGESEDFPAEPPPYTGGVPEPRYPARPPDDFPDDFPDTPGFFDFDEPSDDRTSEFARPEPPGRICRTTSSTHLTTSRTFRDGTRSRWRRTPGRRPAATEPSASDSAVTATTTAGDAGSASA